MGKSSKNKGKRGELMLVHFLEELGLNAHRGYVFLKQSDLVGIVGIHVECKFVEALNVRKAMKQAIEEAGKRKDGMPAVFWKKSREEWLTVMRTEDWAQLYKLARWGSKSENTERADSSLYEDE